MNDYDQYWRDRARLMEPRFKNYGVLCEVHHGEYGAVQTKFALATICTKLRSISHICMADGCDKPSEVQIDEHVRMCAEHAR